jgi:uncharacterized membrane-anchored protein
MPTLQLEHPITDFDLWKRAFDSDPIGRERLGVRRHRVSRPVDDTRYVVVELDFDTEGEAETARSALRELWRSRQAAPALAGDPKVRIVDTVESQEY